MMTWTENRALSEALGHIKSLEREAKLSFPRVPAVECLIHKAFGLLVEAQYQWSVAPASKAVRP